MPDQAYSIEEDLLLGDLPLPSYLNKEKVILDAAREIDSYLGFMYETPFDLAETSEMPRPARLLIQRISNFIASGRLLMEVATAGQDDRTHAYANRLLREAMDSIRAIQRGDVDLGIPILVDEATPKNIPLIGQQDPHSHVEKFYDEIIKPPAFPYLPYYNPESRGF